MDNTQDKSKSKASKVGGTILNILLWIFVVFAVVVTVFVFSAQKDADGIPSLFGNSYISIVSDSMAPEIRTGDMIIVKKVSGTPEASQCKVGDIITFYSSQDINGDGLNNDIETHRIVSIRNDGTFVKYTTMGDNEEYSHGFADPEIYSNSVIGIYTGTRIPGLGSVVSFLGSSTGFLVCIVIPLAIFFLYELIHFVVLFIKVKGPKEAKAGITAADEEEIKRRAIEEYLAKQSAGAAATSQGTEPEKDAPVEESAVESGEQASDETVEQPEEKSEEPVEEASEEVAEAPVEEAEVPSEEVEEQAENTESGSSDVDESKKDDSKTE